MAIGAAIASAAISGLGSLFGGFGAKRSAEKQYKDEREALEYLNWRNEHAADRMNAELRARADVAALTPITRSTREASTIDTRGMVDMPAFLAAAKAGGFNPLSFLRSGALAYFAGETTRSDVSTWETRTGENAMQAALVGQYMPNYVSEFPSTRVPSSSEVWGNAFQTATNQYVGDMAQQRQNNFQAGLLGMQLQAAGQRRASGSNLASSLWGTPSSKQVGGTTTNSGTGALSGGGKGVICIGPFCLTQHEGTSGAQAMSDRYGEIVEMLGGLLVLGTDTLNTLPQLTPKVTADAIQKMLDRDTGKDLQAPSKWAEETWNEIMKNNFPDAGKKGDPGVWWYF